MLASPGWVVEAELQVEGSGARVVCLWVPSWGDRHLRREGESRAVDRAGRAREVATVPWSPTPCEAIAKGSQLVGLIMKLGLSMLTWIERSAAARRR